MANVDYIVEYDRSDPISIETYSQKMVGKTFREIREADEARRPMISPGNDADYGQSDVSETKRNKGNLGK